MDDPKFILAFDPGLSSGISLIGYSDDDVWLEVAYQVEGGLSGSTRWIADHTEEGPYGREGWIIGEQRFSSYLDDVTVIAEKFVPLSGGTFHLTLPAVEPLRIGGALVYDGLMPDYPDPRWRRPDKMYLYGGKVLAERKKRANKFLKDSGFYLTGKDVGCKDADDARSATLHGLSYLAQVVQHKPTFTLMTEWTARND